MRKLFAEAGRLRSLGLPDQRIARARGTGPWRLVAALRSIAGIVALSGGLAGCDAKPQGEAAAGSFVFDMGGDVYNVADPANPTQVSGPLALIDSAQASGRQIAVRGHLVYRTGGPGVLEMVACAERAGRSVNEDCPVSLARPRRGGCAERDTGRRRDT